VSILQRYRSTEDSHSRGCFASEPVSTEQRVAELAATTQKLALYSGTCATGTAEDSGQQEFGVEFA
jgi:hypothetical protein